MKKLLLLVFFMGSVALMAQKPVIEFTNVDSYDGTAVIYNSSSKLISVYGAKVTYRHNSPDYLEMRIFRNGSGTSIEMFYPVENEIQWFVIGPGENLIECKIQKNGKYSPLNNQAYISIELPQSNEYILGKRSKIELGPRWMF